MPDNTLNPNKEMPVIFKIIRKELTAFLPTAPVNPGMIGSYAHVGQHSEASMEYFRLGRLATPEEYADLLSELRGIYESDDNPVKLVVRSRDSTLCQWLRYDFKKAA